MTMPWRTLETISIHQEPGTSRASQPKESVRATATEITAEAIWLTSSILRFSMRSARVPP